MTAGRLDWVHHCSSVACLCVLLLCVSVLKDKAPGLSLLHILICLTSFSFLLGAQALTTTETTAAAAAASNSQQPSNSPYRRRRCKMDKYPMGLFAVSQKFGEKG